MNAVVEPFQDPQVRAAGGVVWRRVGGEGPGPAGVEVVVVHRPHRQDWSLPKGKLDQGESIEAAALREIWEETGYRCALGLPLGTVSYRDHRQRTKTVWYFVMNILDGTATINEEVDEIEWLALAPAGARLSYDADLVILERFAGYLAQAGAAEPVSPDTLPWR